MDATKEHVINPGQESHLRFIEERGLTPGGSMRQAAWFEPSPPYAAVGSGCWVTDVDGRRYVDCANNFFSLVHGHAFPPIIEAIKATVDRGTAFGLPTDHEMHLARRIKARAGHIEQIRFCNSGTEAVMFAIKAVRALTGRQKIAKFEGAYHGSYDYAEVSLATKPEDWGSAWPISRRYSAGTPQSVCDEVITLPWNDIDTCEAILSAHGADIAGILVDLMPSRIGMILPEPGFIERLSAAARSCGAMLVADEVVSFRFGYAGASPIFGFDPDLVALGKVIGGGLPVGAVGGKAEAMAAFDHVSGTPAVAQGGTFSANPVTMTAGDACLQHLDQPAIDQLNQAGWYVVREVNDYLRRNRVAAQLAGYGSLFRLHLTAEPIRSYRDAYATPQIAAAIKAIHQRMLSKHILLTPNCSAALSTAMPDAAVENLIATLCEAIRDCWRVS